MDYKFSLLSPEKHFYDQSPLKLYYRSYNPIACYEYRLCYSFLGNYRVSFSKIRMEIDMLLRIRPAIQQTI